MNPRDVCVLIPGYNESRAIAGVVRSVQDLGFPVLVIDDGSTDNMAEKAREAGAQVLSYGPNQGKGMAIRRGTQWFLEKSSYRAAIFMDSDGQHDPADLSLFLNALETSDFVVGNRMADPKGMPLVRRLTNRFMSALLSLVARQWVPDTQCGYRAATRDALSKICLKTTRFEIESEMVLEAGRVGSRVASVPVKSLYRGETSDIRPIRDSARFFKFLLAYIFRKKTKI